MNAISHTMKKWEINFGQISIGVGDYETAIELFEPYLGKTFDMETFVGTFKNRRFLHYKEIKGIRLACKPFFGKLKEREIICIQPSGERTIKITREEVVPPTPPEPPMKLANRLREAQRNSRDSTIFERVLVEAFDFLGFTARHIGGRDEPDILINDNFNVILDAKTTKKKVISERYINFDAMERYREKYAAERIGVVAPGFSKGYVRETAKKKGITLIETETICKILRNHTIYPYEPERLVEILFGSGKTNITPRDVPSSTSNQQKLIDIVAKVLSALKNFERSGISSFKSHTIHIALVGQGCTFEIHEIERALEFLSEVPFSILRRQNEKYSMMDSIDSVLKKIGLLVRVLNKVSEGM